MYEGELTFSRNQFINDATFNTLQSDLYDSSMAEVLGRVQTSALATFADWDWSDGHHLVIVWPDYLEEHVNICPYGEYYDPAASDHGDGDVQVFETFTDPLVLRDSSSRDLSQNIEVVLNIRHDYDLDVEDITELLIFRIAMIPKTWTDAYGDTIKKTAGEISDCLNLMVSNKAKVDGQFRKVVKKKKPGKKPNKWNKNKNKGGKNNKWKGKTHAPGGWKKKQAARQARLGNAWNF